MLTYNFHCIDVKVTCMFTDLDAFAFLWQVCMLVVSVWHLEVKICYLEFITWLKRLGSSTVNTVGQVVLSQAGLRKPRASVKLYFSSQSYERKFRLIPFSNSLMIDCSKKNWESYPKMAFEQRNIETCIEI